MATRKDEYKTSTAKKKDCKSVAYATQVRILPSPPLYGGGREAVKPNGTEKRRSRTYSPLSKGATKNQKEIDTMNTFMNAMKRDTNFTLTENGAVTHKSTLNGLMDLFALGGAYRTRSDADCITLFKAAFDEDEVHALKCLFYLRDVRGGKLFA